MEIKVEYKGYEITYSEFTNDWQCNVADKKNYKKDSLAEVKIKIDEFIKKENAFDKIEAFYIGREDAYGGEKIWQYRNNYVKDG